MQGLTRSESKVEASRQAGAEPLHGNLEDLDSLRQEATASGSITLYQTGSLLAPDYRVQLPTKR